MAPAKQGDWRLKGQESYLMGARLSRRPWPAVATSDHDHCEFCYAKFSGTTPSGLHHGWITEGEARWICDRCFEDFRDRFRWRVAGPEGQ